MRSRRTKPVRINVGEDDEEEAYNGDDIRSQGNGKSSNQTTSGRKSTNNDDPASFKKRQPFKKKQVKTSFGVGLFLATCSRSTLTHGCQQNDGDDDEEDANDNTDNPVILKRNRRPKTLVASM